MPERDLSIGEALDLGTQLAIEDKHDIAIGLFRGVLMHEPDNFEAKLRLGSSLFARKEYHEALYHFWRGRKINRRHPLALTNYGLCLSQLGHWEEGLVELHKALYLAQKTKGISPEVMALIWNNIGNTYQYLERYEESLRALDKGLTYNRNEQFAHYNRGIALLRLNRHAEGIAALDLALELRPTDHDARYNRSLALLLTGNLKAGFEDYEARLVNNENEKPNFGLPESHKWHGEALEGKTLLLHGEQGLGDYVQFFRFLPILMERYRPAKVEFVCHTAVAEWAKAIPGITVLPPRSEITARHDDVGGYDYWTALMSLPWIFGIAHEKQFPAPWLPPLQSDSQCIDVPQSDSLRVGVAWAGNWLHKNDKYRSIPLAAFAEMFDAPVNFVSLQQMRAGETEEFAKIQEKRPNLSALYFDDLRDTAVAIEALDLVISVDTAVAHLAASLGKPTWILIPKFSTDWRWGLGRPYSPWYPSAKLYRQPKINDWTTTLAAIRRDLQALPAKPRRCVSRCDQSEGD